MSKRIIAVVPLWDDEKESIWMLPRYMDGIRDSGAIPVILPLSSSTHVSTVADFSNDNSHTSCPCTGIGKLIYSIHHPSAAKH